MIKVILYEIVYIYIHKLHVWERLTKTCPCWLPWRLSTSLAVSLHLSPHPCRNEWEPPDKKVDTRKYRAEPKSIFEYEPGKSSVLKQERKVWCSLYTHVFWVLLLCMPFDAARAGFCLFHLKGQHTHSLVVLSDLGRWLVLVMSLMLWYTVLCIAYMTWS